MDAVQAISQGLAHFRNPEHWLTRRKGLILAASITVAAIGATKWIQDLTALPKLPLAAFIASSAALFLLTLVAWWMWKEYRLRSGPDGKVAIAHEGYALSRHDWTYTRTRIEDHFDENRLRSHVTLRLIPFELVRTDIRRNRFMRRYGFSCVVRITASSTIKGRDNPHWQFELFGLYKGNLRREFLQATGRHMAALATAPPSEVLTEILSFRASSLYQITLLAIAVYYVSCNRPLDAAEILWVLDDALGQRFQTTRQPRAAIRWLGALSESACARVFLDPPPDPQVLESVVDRSSRAVEKYGKQFPLVYVNHARAAFLRGDFDAACSAITQAEKLQLDESTAAMVVLGAAVLNLFQSRYQFSAEKFFALFQHENLSCLDWSDLCLFAEYCADCGYQGAPFLQGAYCKMSGKKVPAPIERTVRDWINADGSRNPFLSLYENIIPAAYATMRKVASKQQRKPSPPKRRKGRKNKRRKRR